MQIHDSTSLYNGEIISPNVFKAPEWFLKNKEHYRTEILKTMKETGKVDNEQVKFLIEQMTLNKIKPKYPLNKKTIVNFYSKMYDEFGNEDFRWRYQLIYEFGFFLSTLKPSSFSPESMILPEDFRIKKEKISLKYHNSPKKEKDIILANKEIDELAEELMEYFRKNKIYAADLIDSGGKGSSDDIRKLLLGVGLSINSEGEINDVILNAHSEGLTKTQFFNYSSQGIVALYSKSMNTSKPGYLIRKLYTTMESLELSTSKDCGTKRYLKFKIHLGEAGEKILNNLKGRIYSTSASGSSLEQISTNLKDIKHLLGKTIYLRSALYCQARDGICKTCYNPLAQEELQLKDHSKIGQISVASFAESLVNITLKSSHTGLSLDAEEVNLIEDMERYSK